MRGFFPHAWAEVYVGKWIAVDPTFGERIAGAARIKLFGDDDLETPRAMKILERLNIEVVAEDDHQAE